MLYEWRTYRFAPGAALRYLEAFRAEGLGLVTRHLPMLGYWLTEVGRLNHLHHLWVYRDLADRAACRAALAGDAEWMGGFGPRAFPMIEGQETCLLDLVAGSAELDAAVAAARAVREGPAGNLFAPAWAMVEFGDSAEGAVATWRVLAGDRPGSRVALSRWPAMPEAVPEGKTGRRELMRPCSFSPL